MKTYLELLDRILTKGEPHHDRTGVGTLSLFGEQIRMDMRQGFPLLTTKKMFFRGVAEELFWFLSGSTDVKDLQARGVAIWDEWATAEQCAKFNRPTGELGPVYGTLMRAFPNGPAHTSNGWELASDSHEHCDQITTLVREINETPNSRRLIVSHWHPYWSRRVTLPACHTLWQVKCHQGDEMSLHLYARSIDSFLGLPFNIASYALLLELLCATTFKTPRDLIVSFGDVHVYTNHMIQCREQMKREPRELPQLRIKEREDALHKYTWDHFSLEGYDPHPAIKAEVAV